MKNSIKITFLVLASLFSTYVFSQSAIGIRGGVNFATFNENIFADVPTVEKGFIIGADIAVFSTINMGGALSVQPELHWIQKGTESSATLADDTKVMLKYNYNFLELPILFRLDFGSDVIGVNFFAGPSVGWALNRQYIGENVNAITLNGHPFGQNDFDEEVDWDTEYGADGVKDNRFDVSAVGGLGVYYNVGDVQLLLDARYSHDFTDLVKYKTTPDPEPTNYYNRGVAITAGVAVPLGM